jgi:hypothetical protein
MNAVLKKWTGIGGFLAWPPRLSDLTPLDIFFGGYVNNITYKKKSADFELCNTA